MRKGRHLQLIEQLPLNSRQQIVIVQSDEVKLVLGVSPNQIELLHQSAALVHEPIKSKG